MLKHRFERHVEYICQPNAGSKTACTFPLNRDDRLPRRSNLLGQILLRHLSLVETQHAGFIADYEFGDRPTPVRYSTSWMLRAIPRRQSRRSFVRQSFTLVSA